MKDTQKKTVPRIVARKKKREKVVMVTAYDATFARLVDQADVDIILVGDSLGMVIQGHENTIPVTLDDMIYHTRAVARGVTSAHIAADLPFMSYKISKEQALAAAGRLVQEGRAESVKLEGGCEMADTIYHIVSAGIPVVGHVGLTPQSVHALGGHRVQGKKGVDRARIIEDATAVAEAGAFCLVLEGIPMELAEAITAEVPIPTIGIGAGPHCDGQVLVIYDLIGMNPDFSPRFLKKYAEVGETVRGAVSCFASEVREGCFPTRDHSVSIQQGRQPETTPIYGTVSRRLTH